MYLGEDIFGLQPLWAEVVAIYLEFRRICEKHGLKHYVAYGTALGAVRHHGFIPWDDDFDVMMPRPDYERLKGLLSTELPGHLKFIDWRNAKDYAPVTYGKIQNCNRSTIETVEQGIGRELPHGIYIDIFPLDGFPSGIDFIIAKIQAFLLASAQSSLFGVFTKRKLKICCWRMLGCLVRHTLCRVSNLMDVASWREAISTRYTFGQRHLCGCIFSPYGAFQEACKCEDFGDGKDMPFGDITVRVPTGSDAYLKNLYGDYMQLPPEEKCAPTHEKLEEASWKYGPNA